jgi:hypothetical protein
MEWGSSNYGKRRRYPTHYVYVANRVGPKVTSLAARGKCDLHDVRGLHDAHRTRILRVTYAWNICQIHAGFTRHIRDSDANVVPSVYYQFWQHSDFILLQMWLCHKGAHARYITHFRCECRARDTHNICVTYAPDSCAVCAKFAQDSRRLQHQVTAPGYSTRLFQHPCAHLCAHITPKDMTFGHICNCVPTISIFKR